ncbi:MAG TPA: TIGR02996 domain-containing protein [Pirellulaceae bacterium]|jgi:uncharacterized protein (TIGR02996 family)|nr:TIGR02996 domain-containing protein [Pirellulaceae bacterium]
MPAAIFEDPTTEEQPFVDAVCASPSDDAPRLVFADWLDEQGDPQGEWLRASVAIERAIAELGWGFAFRPWRSLLPRLLPNDAELQAAIATCAGQETPTWNDLPQALRRSLTGHQYCGGFIENVRNGVAGLSQFGDQIRRLIPLRGVDLMRGLPGREADRARDFHGDAWPGVERLVVPCGWGGDSFAPLVNVARAREFAAATDGIRAVATGPHVHPKALAAFLNAKPIESLYVELLPASGDLNLDGLFASWDPQDLRCLGLKHQTPIDASLIAQLADWPGLANVRLLDFGETRLGQRARQALVRARHRRPDLCIAYHAVGRKPAPMDGVKWIVASDDFPMLFDGTLFSSPS